MVIENCKQTKCIFNKLYGTEMLCPECSECGAESNIINDSCVNCWCCYADDGYIRIGKSKFEKNAMANKNKIMIEIKNEK